jgi:hypothetical protein
VSFPINERSFGFQSNKERLRHLSIRPTVVSIKHIQEGQIYMGASGGLAEERFGSSSVGWRQPELDRLFTGVCRDISALSRFALDCGSVIQVAVWYLFQQWWPIQRTQKLFSPKAMDTPSGSQTRANMRQWRLLMSGISLTEVSSSFSVHLQGSMAGATGLDFRKDTPPYWSAIFDEGRRFQRNQNIFQVKAFKRKVSI